jgi:hypothetical protein
LDADIRYDALQEAAETAYQHKPYAYRGQRLEELDSGGNSTTGLQGASVMSVAPEVLNGTSFAGRSATP